MNRFNKITNTISGASIFLSAEQQHNDKNQQHGKQTTEHDAVEGKHKLVEAKYFEHEQGKVMDEYENKNVAEETACFKSRNTRFFAGIEFDMTVE